MKKLAVAILAVLVILVNIIEVVYAEDFYYVKLNVSKRNAVMYGQITFKVDYELNLKYDNNVIAIPTGSIVSIDISDDAGKIWIGSDGYINWNKVYVTKVTVNGKDLIENKEISLEKGRIDLSSISSSLTVKVLPDKTGWTNLVFGNNELINRESSDEIVVIDLRANSTRSLNIDISSNNIYVEGVASAAYVNGVMVPEASAHGVFFLALSSLSLISLIGYIVNQFKSRFAENRRRF